MLSGLSKLQHVYSHMLVAAASHQALKPAAGAQKVQAAYRDHGEEGILQGQAGVSTTLETMLLAIKPQLHERPPESCQIRFAMKGSLSAARMRTGRDSEGTKEAARLRFDAISYFMPQKS